MLNKNIEAFIGCDAEYESADIVLFGAPFDSTTSYRAGARAGSSAMRHESFAIETYSPYLDADLCDYDIFDSGDLELCFGDTQSVLADIEERTATILRDGKLPIMLGGEHLVTLGAVRAVFKEYEELEIVHLDAHADLRDDYLGCRLSHACVMRRCHELVGDGKIHQFCIRSGDREEFLFATGHTDMHKFSLDGLSETIEQLGSKPVYLTIDLDCLDPAFMAGTGTAEAGGITTSELIGAIHSLSKLNIVGADINELAPSLDPSGNSTTTACKLLRELLLAIELKRKGE